MRFQVTLQPKGSFKLQNIAQIALSLVFQKS